MIRDAAYCVGNTGKPCQEWHLSQYNKDGMLPISSNMMSLQTNGHYLSTQTAACWHRSVVYKPSPRFARFMVQDSSHGYSGASTISSS